MISAKVEITLRSTSRSVVSSASRCLRSRSDSPGYLFVRASLLCIHLRGCSRLRNCLPCVWVF